MHMLTQRIIKMGGGEPVSATTGVRQVQGFSHARASTGSDLHPFPHAWDPQPPTSHVDPGWLLCPECRCRPPCSMASVPSYGCVCANHLMHQKARFTNSSSICFSVHRLPIGGLKIIVEQVQEISFVKINVIFWSGFCMIHSHRWQQGVVRGLLRESSIVFYA
ncbi:uncharacterized protein [Triticum aestivum]|uniref:uncharacterized protein isoform X3 n=1 Tax=Triticum aestivum TaxID=4565 RepID=UPI001D023189|nr:uncharacterized protein LOC123096529 isoform X3 [Triticum aestivum]